jgi:hypothetical protein
VQLGIAIKRIPRVSISIVRAFLEGDAAERFVILVMSSVGLAIAALGIAMAGTALWQVVTIPAWIRAHRGDKVAIAAVAFQIGMRGAVFFICLSLVALVMLAADSLFTREGRFSGAGAAIVWPQATSAPAR